MSLTVKHLNTDASFLLTFQPILPFPPTPGLSSSAFTIVIDPWLSGASNIFHPFFSTSKIKDASCISSLTDIPEPNLIIISQAMSDHCHKTTLTKLPKTGGKFTILAEPSAAKLIRSWKHFDDSQVITLKEWTKAAKGNSSNIHRIPLPALSPQGHAGETTISLIKEGDTAGVKNAIAITYRAPTSDPYHDKDFDLPLPFTPPASPRSQTSPSTPRIINALSVLHVPHGINYTALKPFITTHLITTASLPLAALLHCFDKVENPRWLGGNICAGAPSGVKISEELMARVWISAHDGDKEVKGVANKKLKVTRFQRSDIAEVVSPRTPGFPDKEVGTQVLVLGPGEERVVSGVGLWPDDRRDVSRNWGAENEGEETEGESLQGHLRKVIMV